MIITFLIAKILLDGYWLMLAPVLFLPLGIVLLNSHVRRGILGYVVVPLSIAFAALGAILLLTLTLRDAVTVFARVQAVWWPAAAIAVIALNGRLPGGQSQKLRRTCGTLFLFPFSPQACTQMLSLWTAVQPASQQQPRKEEC